MERLTERIKRLQKDDLIVYTNGKYEDTIPAEMTNDDIRAVLKKLGTEVFVIFPGINHYAKCQIKKIEIKPNIFEKICYFIEPVVRRGQYLKYFNNKFGETIFLTREEAEKKLKEMKEECLSL